MAPLQVDMRGVLRLLQAEPTLLPPVQPGAPHHQQVEHRRAQEIHPCLVCGQLASVALIALTRQGPRWLDLCGEHHAAAAEACDG